jgi:hypothetical protein
VSHFYFAIGGSKSAQCSKNIDDESINMASSRKKRKGCERTHELININHTMQSTLLLGALAQAKNGDKMF